MANDFRPAPRPKNALDNRKLNLLAPCPTAPGKTSAMTTNVFTADKTGEPNVRITVFTRDPEDQGERNGYGKIIANLDPIVFFAFLNKLEAFANGAAGTEEKLKLEEKGYGFFGGKRSEAPVVKSELHFGKDADGVVWVSVILPNRPKIKFPFGPSDFYNLVHRSGEQVSKAEASVMWANGWIALMRQMVPHFLIQGFKDIPYDPTAGKGGNGGGGGNWNNNNRGGNSGGGGGNGGGQRQVETTTASDDDIPW